MNGFIRKATNPSPIACFCAAGYARAIIATAADISFQGRFVAWILQSNFEPVRFRHQDVRQNEINLMGLDNS